MNIIQEFFDQHPGIVVSEIEREVGCPTNTLRNYLYNHRGFPVKHTISLVKILIRYGFQPHGWQLEYDDETGTFTGSRPIPDKEQEVKEDETGTFEYYIPHYRTLMADVHDLLDFLENA